MLSKIDDVTAILPGWKKKNSCLNKLTTNPKCGLRLVLTVLRKEKNVGPNCTRLPPLTLPKGCGKGGGEWQLKHTIAFSVFYLGCWQFCINLVH